MANEVAAQAANAANAAGAAGAAFGIGAKVAALFGVGAVGALILAAFDPPPTKRLMFLQALCAGVVAILFTPLAVRFLIAHMEWAHVAPDDPAAWLELALPVGFLIGSMSWGIVGALVKLRQVLRDRAATALLRKAGVEDAL